jgi:probable F420-dependent oxidoreductase
MKIGFMLPHVTPFASTRLIKEFALQSEALGFNSLWVQDHFLYPEVPIRSHVLHQLAYGPDVKIPWPKAYEDIYAPMETLAYLAGITSSVRLGTSILVFGYHRPVTLAKQVATIDQLSGGRFELGLGIGWAEEEYDHMGIPFNKRGARCSDFIRALRAAWKDNPTEYKGPFYNFPKGSTSPKPVQRDSEGNPAVPILGGFNNEASYSRLAQLCDKWVPSPMPKDVFKAEMAKINTMAEEQFGRPPVELVTQVLAAPLLPGIASIGKQEVDPSYSGTLEQMLPGFMELRDAGVSELIINCTFTEEINSEEAWLNVPKFFAPLLEISC